MLACTPGAHGTEFILTDLYWKKQCSWAVRKIFFPDIQYSIIKGRQLSLSITRLT